MTTVGFSTPILRMSSIHGFFPLRSHEIPRNHPTNPTAVYPLPEGKDDDDCIVLLNTRHCMIMNIMIV